MSAEPAYEHTDYDVYDNYEHIGAYLRDVREHFGLQVEDVAATLHIRSKYIRAMEEGKLADLPGDVYIRGYLHNYADYLGLNGEEVVRRYHQLQQLPKHRRFFVPRSDMPEQKPDRSLLWLSAILALLVYAVWYFFIYEAAPETPRVSEVPARLSMQADASWRLTEDNAPCLDPTMPPSLLPCYLYVPERAVQSIPFTVQPTRTIMEW